MILNIVILFVSFYILVKSSDYFVKSSSSIAKTFGISELVIGLTLVAIGTSIPELASSIVASISGSGSIVVGNIVGSNVANIALIVGISALLFAIPKNRKIVIKDGYILLFITGLFVLALSDLKITFIEGIVLLVLYFSYLMFLFEKKESQNENEFREYINYIFLFKYLKKVKSILTPSNRIKKNAVLPKKEIGKNVAILLLSMFGIVVGAKYLIAQAIFFAELFNLSEVFIGLTLIAIGTSLPELSVTLSAIKNGLSDIAIGNVIGSNIANILLVGGASALFSDISIVKSSYNLIMPFLFGITVLFLFLLNSKGISKIGGAVLLILYSIFIAALFLV